MSAMTAASPCSAQAQCAAVRSLPDPVRSGGPGLIINTTLYNNGRRLAITTLPPEALRYDFFRTFESRWHGGDSPPAFRRVSKSAGRRCCR